MRFSQEEFLSTRPMQISAPLMTATRNGRFHQLASMTVSLPSARKTVEFPW